MQAGRFRCTLETIPTLGIEYTPGGYIVEVHMAETLKDREKLKLLQRVRRLRGQMEAVERLVNDGSDCGGQLMLLAAVRGAINALMGEILETHIRFHATEGMTDKIAPELAEDLIDLVRAYLK